MSPQTYFENILPLVLDFGTGFCKTGFAGNSAPSLIYQSCVQRRPILNDGIPRMSSPMTIGEMDYGTGIYKFPIEHGIVTDWDNMEYLWSHGFLGMKVKPQNRILLITEAPLTPKVNREKIAEIMFEKHQVSALYFANTSKMCSHAMERDTCLILEMGEGVTSAVPVENGTVLTDCIQRSDFGGRELTKYLRKLLDKYQLNTWTGFSCKERFSKKDGIRDLVRRVKEKWCFVAEDYPEELREHRYTVDQWAGTLTKPNKDFDIKIGNEKLMCPEGLFNPALLFLSAKGIVQLTKNAINKCDTDIQKTMYENIVLCGGSAQFRGLVERLSKELGPSENIKIIRSDDKNCAWTGAAAFASSPFFRQMCTNKEMYEELGTEYLHKMAERESYLNPQILKFSSKS